MKSLLKKIDHSSVKSLFDNHVSITDISKQFGVKTGVIYTILRKYGIKFGNPKHCDKIGKKFRYLLIKDLIQRGESHHWTWRAICKCENCGNENFETNLQNILRGSVTSCGCRKDQYEKNSGKNNKQFTGYEGIGGKVWSTIKRRAKNRGREFEVSLKEIWELYEKQGRKCALSGMDIVFGRGTSSNTTASVDRIDSSKGYTIENIQLVHKDINIMKNVYSVEYFHNLCQLVVKKMENRQ